MEKWRKFQSQMLLVLVTIGILQFFNTPKIVDYIRVW